MGRASHFKTIAYTDANPVFSRFLRRRDAWTNGDMHAIRRLPHQLFEGVSAGTFLHSNRLSSCCRRGKYPHSTEPVPSQTPMHILHIMELMQVQFSHDRTLLHLFCCEDFSCLVPLQHRRPV